jgi:hypothetical protein
MFIPDSKEWATTLFGNAQLGDPRRTNRLIKLANDMAQNVNASVCSSSRKITLPPTLN